MKIEINFPDTTEFTVRIPVRITDLSQASHVGFDNMVGILNEASTRFLESRGVSRKPGSIGPIYTDLTVSYRSETFYGDTLIVDVAVGNIYTKGYDMLFRVTSLTTGAISALARIGVVFFDYQARKAVPIPEGVLHPTQRHD
jgi:acyl-CoA thioesterase FadM